MGRSETELDRFGERVLSLLTARITDPDTSLNDLRSAAQVLAQLDRNPATTAGVTSAAARAALAPRLRRELLTLSREELQRDLSDFFYSINLAPLGTVIDAALDEGVTLEEHAPEGVLRDVLWAAGLQSFRSANLDDIHVVSDPHLPRPDDPGLAELRQLEEELFLVTELGAFVSDGSMRSAASLVLRPVLDGIAQGEIKDQAAFDRTRLALYDDLAEALAVGPDSYAPRSSSGPTFDAGLLYLALESGDRQLVERVKGLLSRDYDFSRPIIDPRELRP